MTTSSRPYKMRARAAAAEATRERILEAAQAAFFAEWYDEVTLARIATGAGVSTQTVINHFGTKDAIFAASVDRISEKISARREGARPGQVGRAVELLVADYELTGDPTIRMLALEDRVPELATGIAVGRANHRDWVERMIGGGPLLPLLVVATDVYTWKLLRRDQGLSQARTAAAMTQMIDALLEGERSG
jgi:AcrR family transcriptional regulator